MAMFLLSSSMLAMATSNESIDLLQELFVLWVSVYDVEPLAGAYLGTDELVCQIQVRLNHTTSDPIDK